MLFFASLLNMVSSLKRVSILVSHPKIESGFKKFMGVSFWDAINSSKRASIQNQQSFTTGNCRHKRPPVVSDHNQVKMSIS